MTPTWNSGPMSTSKPRSANPVAMTLAPLSWPSCPIFATSSRGFLPSWFLNSATLTLKEKKNKKKTLCYSISPAISMFMMAAGCCIPIVSHGDLFMLPELAAVSAAHHPGAGLVFAKHRLHGVSYFANRTSENQKRRKQKTRSSVRFHSTVI